MKISSHAKIWKNCAWNELGSEASKLVNCRRPESDSKQLINTFQSGVIKLANIMKIAFIHSEKKLGTGAHYINDLMSEKFKQSRHNQADAIINYLSQSGTIELTN